MISEQHRDRLPQTGLTPTRVLLAELEDLQKGARSAGDQELVEALANFKNVSTESIDSESVLCLIVLTELFYFRAQTQRGLWASGRAVEFARVLGDASLVRRALNAKGAMLTDACQVGKALAALHEALSLASQIQDHQGEAAVWTNLGNLLVSTCQYGDAYRCFLRSETLVRGLGSNSERLALVNISGCAQYLRDPASGIWAAEKAIAINPSPSTEREVLSRALAESNGTRLLLMCGESERAEKHCLEARRLSESHPSPRLVYIAGVVQGLFGVYSGTGLEGLRELESMLEFARQHVPSEVGDALSACVMGHEVAGQSDSALVYLHQLLRLNQQTKSDPLTAIASVLPGGGAENAFVLMGSRAEKLHLEVSDQLMQLQIACVNALAAAGHDFARIFRLSKLAERFAQAEGWDPVRAAALGLGASLCDVGMLMVPHQLLRMEKPLSKGERKIVEDHTRIGAELIGRARLAVLQPCVPIAQFHHERWDGTGPWALREDAIPIEARIVSLCDALDSMTAHRPWRGALSLPIALQEISVNAGSKFDPGLAHRFIEFVKQDYWKYDDWKVFLASEAKHHPYVRAREGLNSLLDV